MVMVINGRNTGAWTLRVTNLQEPASRLWILGPYKGWTEGSTYYTYIHMCINVCIYMYISLFTLCPHICIYIYAHVFQVTLLYEAGLFIVKADAFRIGEEGVKFLRHYAVLARMSSKKNPSFFGLIPKIHVIHHIFWQSLYLREQACHEPIGLRHSRLHRPAFAVVAACGPSGFLEALS